MASTKEYRDFILEQLSEAPNITCRPMMGEFLLYSNNVLFGGIYDDRFLIKPTKTAIALMPGASYELPYEGAKEMLLVENVDDSEFLAKLVNAVADEVPAPKSKKKKA